VRRRFSTLSILLPLVVSSTLVLSGTSAEASTPWHRVANLLHSRWDFQAATGSDGRIYAIGGCFTGLCGAPNFTNTVDVYDPASDTWTRLPAHLPGGRAYLAAAGDDAGHIYVLGGLVNPGGSSAPLVFTIATGTWSKLPAMPFPDYYMGAAMG